MVRLSWLFLGIMITGMVTTFPPNEGFPSLCVVFFSTSSLRARSFVSWGWFGSIACPARSCRLGERKQTLRRKVKTS